MKFIRSLHLYLGCLFAPLIILYAISGAAQVYHLNNNRKDGSYNAPQWLRYASTAHTYQSFDPKRGERNGMHAAISKAIAAAMALALALTTLLGIIMAYKFNRNKLAVTFCLLAGIAIPGLLLYLNL